MRQRTLVTAAELLGRLRSGERPAILDVRWRLDRPADGPTIATGTFPARSTSVSTTNSATTR